MFCAQITRYRAGKFDKLARSFSLVLELRLMARKPERVSLTEALKQLADEGLFIDLDGLQRFRDNRLIRFSGQSVTKDDVTQLRYLLLVRDRLGKGWTIPKLAFAATMNGVNGMPPDLVAQYIEDAIAGYLAHQERMLDRQSSGRKMPGSSPEERMARLAVRKYRRDLDLNDDPEVENAMEVLAEIMTAFIGTIYLNRRVANYAANIRRAVYLGTNESTDKDATTAQVMRMFTDILPWLQGNLSTNVLIKEVRQAKLIRPHKIIEGAQDAGHFIAFGDYLLKDIPDPDMSLVNKTKRYDLERLFIGGLPAIIAASSIQLPRQGPGKRLLEMVRRGEALKIRNYMNELYTDSLSQQQLYRKRKSL